MNQQNRVGGHRTVCTLHRSFASVRSAAVKMKRELQEKGLDVLCNNAGIMGDLDNIFFLVGGPKIDMKIHEFQGGVLSCCFPMFQ